jgi:hypothetical protein
LRAKKQITYTEPLRASIISSRLSAAADRPFLLCEKKKKLARKDAKPQRVFPCIPKIKFTKSLPALGRSLRFFPISLRLCAFARQNN